MGAGLELTWLKVIFIITSLVEATGTRRTYSYSAGIAVLVLLDYMDFAEKFGTHLQALTVVSRKKIRFLRVSAQRRQQPVTAAPGRSSIKNFPKAGSA